PSSPSTHPPHTALPPLSLHDALPICQSPGPSGRDKTSILFAMPNQPGALYRILEPFARIGINLTKIESRPTKRERWDFVMFVDLDRKSTRLNSSHQIISYAVFCLKQK